VIGTDLARRWGGRLFGGAVILGYHRIARAARDPFRLCVSPQHFSEHLEVLLRDRWPVPLERLVRRRTDGRGPRGVCAVTLDDGYVDALTAAKPLLERWGMPATVHVVTGAAGLRFWWDELAERVTDGVELHRVHRRLIQQPGRERAAAIAALPIASETPVGDARAMTADELRALATGGLITLGAHSVTHQLLPTLDEAGQRAEVAGSKVALEEIAGHAVHAFAYPHGPATAATRAIARAAGFAWACGAHEGVVRGTTDRFQLPRLWPPDVDGDRFARWLSRWLPRVARTVA
jgi:peptidoglycan/xylan/chitin deacetylase (PgdA/CDA1 family)